jgi:hypothetical protein
MSGCENLLVNVESQFVTATFENAFKTATGELCFENGGTALVRRLRRVIRKLPILGVEPELSRLSASHIREVNSHTPECNKVGRTPFLPLDFYLSWMSQFCGLHVARKRKIGTVPAAWISESHR